MPGPAEVGKIFGLFAKLAALSLFDRNQFAAIGTLANLATNRAFLSGDIYGTFIPKLQEHGSTTRVRSNFFSAVSRNSQSCAF